MVIVVRQGGVIVILASGYSHTGAVLSLVQSIVIVPTEETVRSQSELVASLEPPQAGATTKALHMIDLSFRSHHIVIFAKTLATLVTLGAK